MIIGNLLIRLFRRPSVCLVSSSRVVSPIIKMSVSSSTVTNNTGKSICTHNGVFHCDDVLACYMIRQLPDYRDAPIVRTRDPKVIDSCDIVVDVGGLYDHSKRRYDHHQREFSHTLKSLDPRKPFTIKLSSAGLIYHHYGRQIISRLLNIQGIAGGDVENGVTGCEDNPADDQVEVLFDKIYESFMQEVDAIDNGIDVCDEKPKYSINSDLSSRVAHLRPYWNQESTEEILNERFHEAIKLVGGEFEERVKYFGKAWYPAKVLVKEAVLNRFNLHSSGSIIDLSHYGGLPWKEHLLSIEKEMNIEGEVKFAVFQDTNGNWRVACVPVHAKSFSNRLPLHADWRGLRDEQLSQKSGVPGCIFVHASGFIGGAETKEACIALADKTLAANIK